MPRSSPGSNRIVAASLVLALAASAGALAWISATSARATPLRALWHMIDDAQASHPNALWHIVHNLCVVDMQASGHPAPCARVDLKGGYAVIKDMARRTQYLLIPTARVTGIESPSLLEPGSPNYWRDAWQATDLIAKQLKQPIPREDLGLAVNSLNGRTQNQLHIHIDCVQPEVKAYLRDHNAEFGPRWQTMSDRLVGRWYQVRWVDGADLGVNDPFKLLAEAPLARARMDEETLVVIGASRADGTPGFILLSDKLNWAENDTAAGESLLDHRCRVLSAGG